MSAPVLLVRAETVNHFPESVPRRIMDRAETADFSLVIETLHQVAADPESWDQLIGVLDPDGGEAPPAAVAAEAARAAQTARLAQAPGEGPGAEAPARGDLSWVILSARGRVLSANAGATAALAAGLDKVVPGRPLRFSDPANGEALARALAQAARGGGQMILRLERDADEGPCFAHLVPAGALPAAGAAARAPEAAFALVLPAVEATARLWASIRESFGLTAAEVRLARKLRDGRSLKEAAAELGVSVNTVRNQLSAVFHKMGLQRQSDLVRALTQLSAVAQALDAEIRTGAARVRAEAPTVRCVVLSDGRALAYREYGDPCGKAVMAFHEGLGSSLLPPGSDLRARALGLRVIAPERPGFGQSDPRPDYSFDGVADDMVELADRLGLDEVRLSGVLSGAPSALQTAVRLGRRARFVHLCSARPPRPMSQPSANPLAQFRARAESHPWVLAAVCAILRARMSPGLAARMVRRAAQSAAGDRAYVDAHPDVAAFVEAYVGECLTTSTRGPVDEIKAFRRAGNLTAAALTAPVVVWHGADDSFAPLADLMAYLGDAAREVWVAPDMGPMLALKHWDDMLARLAGEPPG